VKTASAHYLLYGLTLQSRLALPCSRISPVSDPDVRLCPAPAKRFENAREALKNPRDWFCSLRLVDGTFYIRWARLFEFLISPDGRQILYHRLERGSKESFSVYLLGQVLSYSLLALGREPLHGTTVAVDGRAVTFLGDCGYGKSTLGAAMLSRGYPVLTDDVVALESVNGGWTVHPGVPRIKLFPRVARRLLRSTLRGAPMNPGTSKLVLPLALNQTVRRTLQLKTIYVLSDPANDSVEPEQPVIDQLSRHEAFFEIIRAAFNLTVLERERFANQFRFATRLTAAVPVKRLRFRRRLSALPSVCDAVLADLAA
jgi:hypothetical protein